MLCKKENPNQPSKNTKETTNKDSWIKATCIVSVQNNNAWDHRFG